MEVTGSEFPLALLRRIVRSYETSLAVHASQNDSRSQRRLPSLLPERVDMYKTATAYDEPVCCRRLLRSLNGQPWWHQRLVDWHRAYPGASALLFTIAVHYKSDPQLGVKFARHALESDTQLLPQQPSPDRGPVAAAKIIGLCCILNIDKYEDPNIQYRYGSDRDVANISTIFKSLGYRIIHSPNVDNSSNKLMTKEKCIEFRDYCFSEFENLNPNEVACTRFVMFVMGHGADEYNVLTADDKSGDSNQRKQLHCINDLVNIACSQPMFNETPKLFVFQFCRGSYVNYYTDGPTEQQPPPPPPTPQRLLKLNRSYRDVYLCFATLPTYKASRDGKDGSYFVRHFCECAKAEHAAQRPVLLNELMAYVNRQLANPPAGVPKQPVEFTQWGCSDANLKLNPF